MKGIFNNLKGLIIQSDDVPVPVQPVQAITLHQSQPLSDFDVASVLDLVQVEATIDALIQGNELFAPFKIFDMSATSLATVLTDESTRFKAAQATTKLDKVTLIAAVDSFMQVLSDEQTNFETNFVGASEAAIQTINNEAASVNHEIDELTAKLGELSEKKNTLAKDAVDKIAELSKAKIDFADVVNNISKRYTTTSQKLQQYLGA